MTLDLRLAPSVVNGDGLGYLKAAAVGGTLYPGHLAYVPLLRGLGALTSAARAVDALPAARLVSALGAATAAMALGATARRLSGRQRAGAVAALGLSASFGVIASGSDVETYAPALACVCLSLYLVVRGRGSSRIWAFAAGISAGAAALLHVENVLFVLPAALAGERRQRPALVAAAATLVGGAYALALPGHGAAWLASATHGLRYPLHVYTPAVALYGACKALVYAPYPYEASWACVLGCFAVGAAALTALLWLARGPHPLGRAATWAWTLPYAAVGCAFYGSDAERWLFLLPLLWLHVAVADRARRATVVALLMLIVNVALWLPEVRDDRWRRAASSAAARMSDGDLAISPGHGWDEYVGFYDGPAVERFPLTYFAGALGGRGPLAAALAQAVARARAGNHRVWLLRLTDDRDPMGWKELRLFGLGPPEVGALLPPGRRVPISDGIERLD
jgi:hypothetical protein